MCSRNLGEMVIHVELIFQCHLDSERLAKAIELTLDAEPILGCRFVTDVSPIYWERVESSKRNAFIVVETEAEYEEFRLAPHDIAHSTAFKICLLRTLEGDRVLAKVAHEAADAGGAKKAMRILTDIYTRLNDNPRYIPMPNQGSRSLWQVFREIPFKKYPGIFWTYVKMQCIDLWYRPVFRLPMDFKRQDRPFYVLRHIPKEKLAQAVAKYKAMGATINDLLLTAFTRAVMIEGHWDGTTNLRTMYTVDLRKYYIQDDTITAVCNMSLFEFINLGKNPGRTAEETLAKIVTQSAARKKKYPGISSVLLLCLFLLPPKIAEWIFAQFIDSAITKNGAADYVTNMGPLEKSDVTFDTAPAAAWLIVPPVYPPLFGFGVSGYDGGITMSFGGYRPAIDPEKVNCFFDRIESEMPGLKQANP